MHSRKSILSETERYLNRFILDFQEHGILTWLAELMKHRDAADSKRYRMLSKQFIDKFGISTEGYDIIKGWRANASYFYIARSFVRDEIDIDILEELLALGSLGIQYCMKTEQAYKQLSEQPDALQPVSFTQFNEKYNKRDTEARENMRKLIDSDRNRVTKVFQNCMEIIYILTCLFLRLHRSKSLSVAHYACVF